ncbi:MAG: helix-turn-helix domain-containing protein [Patescibacteria group bacterium]|jgi:sugar-specific transcriptional regulator TrmB
MYLELFQNLGLSKNEAEIYEKLLELGEASVSTISAETNINRRNIYDVLNRMMEKGLVFPILQKGDSSYKPVDPNKLMEVLKEKEAQLQKNLPNLQQLYHTTPKEDEVYIYKGLEGWKNYMRDMVQVGEPAYFIGAKGAWLDERVKHFYPQFYKEAQRKKIRFYHLFDWEVRETFPKILQYVKKDYKFLPKGYSAPSGAIDIFGDHVNIISNMRLGGFADEDFSFTVIVNQQIADSFRVWFHYMWDFCPNNF